MGERGRVGREGDVQQSDVILRNYVTRHSITI